MLNLLNAILRKRANKLQIKQNTRIHNDNYDEYEETHVEIFNSIEQERLQEKLKEAIKSIKTESNPKTALDYGCGSGNLTKHLIDMGIYSVAADVSNKLLNLIIEKYTHTGMLGVLDINGQDLSNSDDAHFDLVAAYSVLHHVPDYLKILTEMVRVLKPGGIIYLDHEVNESYWNKNKHYIELQKLTRQEPQAVKTIRRRNWTKYLNPVNYYARLRRATYPKCFYEGDIHVFPHDHIDWNKIEELLASKGCEIVLKEDYLLYRTHYPLDIYHEYKTKCNDMRVLIARKK